MAKNFDEIVDVEILLDIPNLRESVVTSVKEILKEHFESYKDKDK